MIARHAVLLTRSKSSGCSPVTFLQTARAHKPLRIRTSTRRGRRSHLLSTSNPPLCFLTLMKCKFSNSFVLTFIQNAGGVYPPLMVNHPLQSGLGWRRIDRRAGTLSQSVDGIRGKIFKSFDQAAGPAHLHPINLCRSAEAEMDAHVVIGNVAGAAAHFVNESARSRFHRDPCPDAVAVGFDPNRPKRDPVVR